MLSASKKSYFTTSFLLRILILPEKVLKNAISVIREKSSILHMRHKFHIKDSHSLMRSTSYIQFLLKPCFAVPNIPDFIISK